MDRGEEIPSEVLLEVPIEPAPIKILIVPGHDDESEGTSFGSLKEADMTLPLATEIFNKLKEDERFEVLITRNEEGYTPVFAEYFSTNREEIISFINESKEKMKEKIKEGDFVDKSDEQHFVVTLDTGVKLYGINKWANENDVDAVLHIHFNDNTRKNRKVPGRYKGFAIYLPEEQMPNSEISLPFAESIFAELDTKYNTSDNVKELGGLVPNQMLIALGSNETLLENVRSILVEYAYIYELAKKDIREKAYEDMSELTVNGVKKHFLGDEEEQL